MGKNLIVQARGRGGPRYRSPGFRFKGAIEMRAPATISGIIEDIIDCPGHDAPLAKIKYDDGVTSLLPAYENALVGAKVSSGTEEINPGNVTTLDKIPEGVLIYNIELKPGDGGRVCRTPGTSAKIIAKTGDYAIVLLPSKRQKAFALNCRAIIGTVAGGGINEKPIFKAGNHWHMRHARNKRYPGVKGCSQNAVDHPFGNKRSSRKAKQVPVGHSAPPGRKIGTLWPRPRTR